MDLGIFLAMHIIVWMWYLVHAFFQAETENGFRLGWMRLSLPLAWWVGAIYFHYPKAAMTKLVHRLAPGHPEMVSSVLWGSGLLALVLAVVYASRVWDREKWW